MKTRIFQLGIASFIAFLAISIYGVTYREVSQKSVLVADLQNQIEAKAETITRIARARAALSEIAGDEQALQEYFVSESSVVSFITDLEARGVEQGATISVLSVSAEEGVGRPVLALSLSIQGTFDAVMRTAGSIEYAPYAISVSALSASQTAKDLWTANLRLKVGSVRKSSGPPSP